MPRQRNAISGMLSLCPDPGTQESELIIPVKQRTGIKRLFHRKEISNGRIRQFRRSIYTPSIVCTRDGSRWLTQQTTVTSFWCKNSPDDEPRADLEGPEEGTRPQTHPKIFICQFLIMAKSRKVIKERMNWPVSPFLSYFPIILATCINQSKRKRQGKTEWRMEHKLSSN